MQQPNRHRVPQVRVRNPHTEHYTYVPVWLPVRRATASYVAVALQTMGRRRAPRGGRYA